MNTPPTTTETAHTFDTSLLPAWFTERMASDQWSFALLASNGFTICIEAITNIVQAADGSIWIDVVLLKDGDCWTKGIERKLVSPTARNRASVNTAHIVAAYEIADS
jgi:hypothetical protein